MEIVIGLLVVSCFLIALLGSRDSWQRKRCPDCGSYNVAGAKRCAYCTSYFPMAVVHT